MIEIIFEAFALSTWVNLSSQSQVVDKYSKVTMAAILHHGDGGMWVKPFGVSHDPCDDASFSSSVALDHSYSLSDLETLPDLECLCFDLNRLVFFSHEMDIAILDVIDDSWAVFELAFEHLDSVSDLDLELGVVSDGFHEGVVV